MIEHIELRTLVCASVINVVPSLDFLHFILEPSSNP